MREFLDRAEAEGAQLVAHVVLDGLDVVPGRRLDRRERVDGLLVEGIDDGAQLRLLLGRERARAEQLAVGEEDEPLDLDLHAGAVERGFAEVLADRRHRLVVPVVEGADQLRRQRTHRGSVLGGCGLASRPRHGLDLREQLFARVLDEVSHFVEQLVTPIVGIRHIAGVLVEVAE